LLPLTVSTTVLPMRAVPTDALLTVAGVDGTGVTGSALAPPPPPPPPQPASHKLAAKTRAQPAGRLTRARLALAENMRR
jgi:hypothetical protein